MQSMGIGGGFFMTIYDRTAGRAYTLIARDRAPLAANATMYDGKPRDASFIGPLAIGTPGELAGYWEAHKRFGKLPWADLFKPSIELCEEGYNLTEIQHDGFKYNAQNIHKDRILKQLFVDPGTNDFYKPGSVIKPKVLCKTLRIIAEKGASELYNGTIGKLLVKDLQEKGSIITMEDLNTYSITDYNRTILTYHRMIETFKYAYALRNDMADKDFVDMEEVSKLLKEPKDYHLYTEILNCNTLFTRSLIHFCLFKLTENLTSRSYAYKTRIKIDDHRTWDDPTHYGASTLSSAKDQGTAHVSILAPNGDAVSATSTINLYFGSGVTSESTGILLNNAMNDFGVPSTVNYFGVPPSPNNYIAAGKRPVSSMVPSILVDSNGDVKMVIGASGGTKITTTVSQIIAKIMWMGQTVKEAVDAPRIHHQLFPSEISYEYGILKQVVDGLKKIGHKTSRYRVRGSVACVICVVNNTIYANADFRKGGDVYGLD
ncbi:scoloptoxin SSD14 [Colletes latitarsis]|uniref:scoloptoxin SSD14 n=1 Tax=Colletes latitarsis TaxID=2605962 RepID=UPI004036532F